MNIDVTFLQRKFQELESRLPKASGGNNGGEGMESRVAKLEATSEHILNRLQNIDVAIDGIRKSLDSNIENVRKSLDSKFILVWSGIIASFLLTLGFTATGYVRLEDKIEKVSIRMDEKFEKVDERFQKIDERFDRLEQILSNNKKR